MADSNMSAGLLEKNIDMAVRLLKAFSNEKRILILCHLTESEKNVRDLENLVGLSQSALSQHLARLRYDGIVKTRRQGQAIYYSVKNEHAARMVNAIYEIFGGGSAAAEEALQAVDTAMGKTDGA